MDPIHTLMAEHRLIERVLDALGNYIAELTTRGEASREELGRFTDFFKNYADAFHHAKEENILFATMVENGFSRVSGPVAVMLSDHNQNRQYTQILMTAAERKNAAWADEEIAEVVQAAGAYTMLLEPHIHREDTILYPMAASRLPAAAMQKMLREFEAKAADESSLIEEQRLQALAEELCARFAAVS
jgi:hemerythrin-like domain-containing protein